MVAFIPPMLCELRSLLLALMDTNQLLRCYPGFARIAECIVDVQNAIDLHLAIHMAVSVDVNVRVEFTQLALKLHGPQDRIQDSVDARNELRHQINARQKVRVGDDFVACRVVPFVIQCRKVRRNVLVRESVRPAAASGSPSTLTAARRSARQRSSHTIRAAE